MSWMFSCILLVFGCMHIFYNFVPIDPEAPFPPPTLGNVSKQIIQAHPRKHAVPLKVFDTFKTFAPEYKHKVFDHEDMVAFLQLHFGQKYVNAFNDLAYKPYAADMFRYGYLYLFGGIWMDIDTQLLTSMSSIIRDPQLVYSGSIANKHEEGIVQNFLAYPSGHPVMKAAMEHVANNVFGLNHKWWLWITGGVIPTVQLGQLLKDLHPGGTVPLKPGKSKYVYLFEEECAGGDDYECYMEDLGRKILKSRYDDYPCWSATPKIREGLDCDSLVLTYPTALQNERGHT